jgi:DNA mismatch endonuclease (patch repair protein)
MRANRRRDTGPERRLRSALHAAGLRFRVDYPVRVGDRERPIRPDIVFTRARLAVFVDGCYWHGCRRHYAASKSNVDYWTAKIAGNRERDVNQARALTEAGWLVLRFWEHQDPEIAAAEVAIALTRRRPATPHRPR